MGVVTNYLWDEFSPYGDVILETDAAGLELTRYTLGNGQLISKTSNSETEYFLADALGSTRAMTDDAGAVTGTFAYDAFGQLVDQTGTSDTNYLYTGQQYDAETSLYSMRARYYDPSVGRFLTQDTYPYDYQNPIELNRYVYAAGNPVLFSDPSGNTAIFERVSNYVKNTRAYKAISGFIQRPFVQGFVAGGLGYVLGDVLAYVLSTDEGDTAEAIFSQALNAVSSLEFFWYGMIGGLISMTNASPVGIFEITLLSETFLTVLDNGANWLKSLFTYEFQGKYNLIYGTWNTAVESIIDESLALLSAGSAGLTDYFLRTAKGPVKAFFSVAVDALVSGLAKYADTRTDLKCSLVPPSMQNIDVCR